jgi:Holliday junction resolvase
VGGGKEGCGMTVMQRRKGLRIEREIVELHRAIDVHAERVPLSGASRYQGNAADVDIYPFGKDDSPLCCEVKGRKNGEGFATIEKWLSENDVLFLRRNNAEPLIVLPWRTWVRLLAKVRP